MIILIKKYIDLAAVAIVLAVMLFMRVPYWPLILCALFILAISVATKQTKDIGFIKPNKPLATLGVGLIVSLVIYILGFYLILPLTEEITNVEHDISAFAALKGNKPLLLSSLAISWLMGGVVEEIVFRGFLLTKLSKSFPKSIGNVLALVFTSLMFGYMHDYQGITGQILTGYTGFSMGLVYLWKRNIWLNIFIHGGIDTISMFLLYEGLYIA